MKKISSFSPPCEGGETGVVITLKVFFNLFSNELEDIIMAEIGVFNNLRVIKEVDFGVYLDGGEHEEIFCCRAGIGS